MLMYGKTRVVFVYTQMSAKLQLAVYADAQGPRIICAREDEYRWRAGDKRRYCWRIVSTRVGEIHLESVSASVYGH